MLNSLAGVVSTDMAIDLGTANTIVFLPDQGIVLEEPSVVAVSYRDGQRKVIAYGQEAKAMVGRTPEDIETIQPMREGVIADFATTEEMIKHFIRTVHNRNSFTSPRIMVCIPAGATPVERRAVQEATLAAGARKVYLIEESVAAALGAGLPVTEPKGVMVVDIGGGTTDIAIITLGGVVYSRSLRTAGNAMDEAIINYVRHRHHLLIGQSSAEMIKIEGGTATGKRNGTPVEIRIMGRDLRKGVPSEIKLGESDIAEALDPPLEAIAEGVELGLQQIPPELAADICNDGIAITGGGALLQNIDVKLSKRTGIKFKIAEDPLRCVAVGTGLALERLDDVQDLLAVT